MLLVVTTVHAQIIVLFWLTSRSSERFSHSLDTLCPCYTLIRVCCNCGQGRFLCLIIGVRHLPPPLGSSVSASCFPAIIQNSALHMLNKSATPTCLAQYSRRPCCCSRSRGQDISSIQSTFSLLLGSFQGKFHADSSATCLKIDLTLQIVLVFVD